jgi:hypothetical protein
MTCSTNPWNPTAPVSATVAGGGQWTAYITPIPPNTATVPGKFVIHSTGTMPGGPAQRIIETTLTVTPIDLPKSSYARTINLGGTVSLSQMSMVTTGCVYQRSKLSVNNAAGPDLAYGVPAGVHSSQIITDAQGSGQYCPGTNKAIHGGLLGTGLSLLPCNASYPYDQDTFGGSLLGPGLNLLPCSAVASNPAYLPRDINGDGTLDVNGSYLRDDRALFRSLGIQHSALTAANLDQLRTVSQAQGNYYTSNSGWALPTDPHSVLFFDISSGSTVNLSALGSSIFARTALNTTGAGCPDLSLFIVIAGGNAKLNSNASIADTLYLASGAPNGSLQKANGTANHIGAIYADTIDLTGNLNLSLDTCYLENPPPTLFDVTPGTYQELDR